LIIEELQIEGKKPTTSQDFLKGNSDFIGTILG
jgi:methionyl-tRNA formyltransferase